MHKQLITIDVQLIIYPVYLIDYLMFNISPESSPYCVYSSNGVSLDVETVVAVLLLHLSHDSMQTRIATLRWMYHLFVNTPNKVTDQALVSESQTDRQMDKQTNSSTHAHTHTLVHSHILSHTHSYMLTHTHAQTHTLTNAHAHILRIWLLEVPSPCQHTKQVTNTH